MPHLLLLVTGCATMSLDYGQVTFDDGIDKYEAVAIAKNELSRINEGSEYVLYRGNTVLNKEASCATITG